VQVGHHHLANLAFPARLTYFIEHFDQQVFGLHVQQAAVRALQGDDADFLLLRTPEEFEQWERLKDQGEIGELPNFIPPEAEKPEAPKKKGFPEYPEGDLIARALRLAFVGGEGEGGDLENGS
jgi:hypothetical protein